MKLTSGLLEKKTRLGADTWGSTDKDIKQVMTPIEELFKKEFSDYDPYPFGQQQKIDLLVDIFSSPRRWFHSMSTYSRICLMNS